MSSRGMILALLSLLATGVGVASGLGTDPGFGLVGLNNKTCETPGDILSYHVHVVWDGANETMTEFSLAQWQNFHDAMEAEGILFTEGDCPFSHANGSPDFDFICSFIFNQTGPFRPWTGQGLFGGSNWAYHIPFQHCEHHAVSFRCFACALPPSLPPSSG